MLVSPCRLISQTFEIRLFVQSQLTLELDIFCSGMGYGQKVGISNITNGIFNTMLLHNLYYSNHDNSILNSQYIVMLCTSHESSDAGQTVLTFVLVSKHTKCKHRVLSFMLVRPRWQVFSK